MQPLVQITVQGDSLISLNEREYQQLRDSLGAEVRMLYHTYVVSHCMDDDLSIQYVIENVRLEFNTRFMGTRDVVKRLIQHKAQPSAIWVWRPQPEFPYVTY